MAENISEQFTEWSEQFDELCLKRHQAGAEEYGHFTFLENDVVRMMAEELADVANYARMHFIKLMMLQDLLLAELDEKGVSHNIGIGEFKGVGDVGWRKS